MLVRWLIPVGVGAASVAQVAHATQYLTMEQAQRAAFPDATAFETVRAKFDASALGVPTGWAPRVWQARVGERVLGTFFADAVIGKSEAIDYSLALDTNGTVIALEVLQYRESHGSEVRMAPWRMIFLEGLGEMPAHDGLVTHAGDPLLRVIACTGAPVCPEAHAETRALAATLAPYIPDHATLHVSGCAKGCAHPGPCAVTLVGTADGYDLVRKGSPRDAAEMHGLARAQILADPRMLTGAR